jgi:regulator of replication initiation timing
MDILSTVSNSITLVQRLREISKNIAEAEFKNVLADLSYELADLKLEAASLKERLAVLQEENILLKKTTVPIEEGPTGNKWGCYQFASDDGLYCTACWDSKRKKSLTTRINPRIRMCPVCQATLGTG